MSNISQSNLDEIKKRFKIQVLKIKNLEDLEQLRLEFLGRKSAFNKLLKNLKSLSAKERKVLGQSANQLKMEISKKIEDLKESFSTTVRKENWLDATASLFPVRRGKLNIISQTQKEIEEIFTSMGFEVADGPEVESEHYNFDALNFPLEHPARDMQDTFWLEQKNNKGEKLVMRTHTSNCQVRYMEKHQPPFRVIVPGRVFRNEATDAVHEHTFYQFEALVVGEKVSIANFKDIAENFFSLFFGQKLIIRLRPSYFPFTEPSFEFDISCTMCGGKGCGGCKNSGWLEIGGCGMVNQKVFEAAGYQKGKFQGFAWGFGIERMAMMKYKIDDIRLFMSGDLRFIRQF